MLSRRRFVAAGERQQRVDDLARVGGHAQVGVLEDARAAVAIDRHAPSRPAPSDADEVGQGAGDAERDVGRGATVAPEAPTSSARVARPASDLRPRDREARTVLGLRQAPRAVLDRGARAGAPTASTVCIPPARSSASMRSAATATPSTSSHSRRAGAARGGRVASGAGAAAGGSSARSPTRSRR